MKNINTLNEVLGVKVYYKDWVFVMNTLNGYLNIIEHFILTDKLIWPFILRIMKKLVKVILGFISSIPFNNLVMHFVIYLGIYDTPFIERF